MGMTGPLCECGGGRIVRVTAGGPEGRRLAELGAVPGTTVRVLRSAPFGDPLQISLCGFTLAIRRDMAAKIIVDDGR